MSRTSEFPILSQTDALHGTDPAGVVAEAARAHHDVLRGLDGKQACPFCGAVGEKSPAPCPRCGMENTADARKATKARIGPWYVLQARNPAAPGMRFETLLTFVRKGRVRARSVVRGPTTHQLWRFAAHVKGLSREFGLCFSCGSAIETAANICPQCNRLQEPPINPDVLLEANPVEDAPPRAPAVFRDVPAEPPATAPVTSLAAAAVRPAPAEGEDIDIVIPALGGFGPDDLDAAAPEPARPAPLAPITAPIAAPITAPSPAPAFVPAAPAPTPPTPSRFAPVAFEPEPQTPPAAPPARPAAAEENPFSMGPLRRKPNGEASFLSAKDLAAAFQLGFDPSAEMERPEAPSRAAPAAMPDAMLPPAMMPRNPLGPHPEPRRRGFRKFLLFVFILLVTGFGVLMWVDPNFRKQAVEWSKSTYAKLRTGTNEPPARPGAPDVDSFDAPMPPPSAVATTAPATEAERAGSAEREVTGPASPAAEPDGDAGSGAVAEADRAGEGAEETETAAEDDGVEPEMNSETTSPERAGANTRARNAGGVRGKDGPTARDEAAAYERMMELYQSGIDAEADGDYTTAIENFEQIKKMPKPWPGNLQLVLDRVTRKRQQQEQQE